ncbi:hypothetical protein B0H14DRAFT_2652539, partial [Mycena olivaceomarginata]
MDGNPPQPPSQACAELQQTSAPPANCSGNNERCFRFGPRKSSHSFSFICIDPALPTSRKRTHGRKSTMFCAPTVSPISGTFLLAFFIPVFRVPDHVRLGYATRRQSRILPRWETRTKESGGGSRRRHLRATTNGRVANADVVTWEDTEFTLQGLARQYQDEDPFVWYMTECFTASRKKGKVIVKKNRPHPVLTILQIQVGAISSFILSRNQYASGELGLPLGLWLFACQAHVDIKRVFCRFGYSKRFGTQQRRTADYGKILDNIQRYDRVFEQGLGRESQLKVGTACTAFRLENAKPGALRADDHIARVIAQERQKMTTESVLASIDWEHNYSVADLHFVRILADFIPHLNHLSTEISTRFRTTLAKRR